MNEIRNVALRSAIGLCGLLGCLAGRADVIFERISAYHHIQVIDEGDMRRLSFNGSWETRMSLTDPLKGHFEYTEYFQMPWIWNTNIHRVLMAGLGGGSTQRAYQYYYPNVLVDTVEIDPVVVAVAKKYFHVTETPRLRIHTNDARVFLRRTTNTYDVILMDAYSMTRYGASLPAHLTTKEFFTIAKARLSTNGVLAYNVIGQIRGYRASVIGTLYRTMKAVFPQVYMFPADKNQNVVLLGTKSPTYYDPGRVQHEAATLVRSGTVTFPTFYLRSRNFIAAPPPSAAQTRVLTDDYAPIESLLQGSQ